MVALYRFVIVFAGTMFRRSSWYRCYSKPYAVHGVLNLRIKMVLFQSFVYCYVAPLSMTSDFYLRENYDSRESQQ